MFHFNLQLNDSIMIIKPTYTTESIDDQNIDNFDMIEFDYALNEIKLYSKDSIVTKEEYDHIRMRLKNTRIITLINDFLLLIMIIIIKTKQI